jgi:hypothetical protein
LLQAGENQPALPPQNQFPVDHPVGIELFEGGHDLGEVPGEGALLPRLEGDPCRASVGYPAVAVELGFVRTNLRQETPGVGPCWPRSSGAAGTPLPQSLIASTLGDDR